MLTTARNIAYACVLVVGFSLSVGAQTDPNASFEFDKIEVGEDRGWEFKSENESVSVQDNLENLREYSISDLEDSDVRLVEDERRWDNRGDGREYSIETDVYDY